LAARPLGTWTYRQDHEPGDVLGHLPGSNLLVLAGLLVEVDLKVAFLAAGSLLVLTAVLGATSRTMRKAD
jgi:hypothetical protein